MSDRSATIKRNDGSRVQISERNPSGVLEKIFHSPYTKAEDNRGSKTRYYDKFEEAVSRESRRK